MGTMTLVRRCLVAVGSAALAFVLAVGTGRAQDVSAPDPPGFADVTLTPSQAVRLSVVCFDHQVGELPPDPCHGELMLHDAAGNVLKRGTYDLEPGESAFLRLVFAPSGDGQPRLGIAPCVLPAPGGLAIPSVEVIDTHTGRVVHFANPAAARMSEFNNGIADPGSIVGFNPQPDPPGFGLVTIRTDQTIRLSVACYDHPIGAVPPDPCRGELMFHDARGLVVARGTYDLQPGQRGFLRFAPDASDVGGAVLGINPCILPAPGGRAVPSVEVIDRSMGRIALLVQPAVARMSQFQRR